MRISDWSSDVCSSDLTRGGVPITVGQIADVKVGGDLRTGAGSLNGKEAVIGTVLMLIDKNSRIVAESVTEKIDQVSKTLPPGVDVNIILNRAALVGATVGTVETNITEGELLVAAALFLLLVNWRAAIIAALVIPFSSSEEHTSELPSLMRISF